MIVLYHREGVLSTPYLEFFENNYEDSEDEESHHQRNPEGGEDPYPGPMDNAHELEDDEGYAQQGRKQVRDGNSVVLIFVHFN